MSTLKVMRLTTVNIPILKLLKVTSSFLRVLGEEKDSERKDVKAIHVLPSQQLPELRYPLVINPGNGKSWKFYHRRKGSDGMYVMFPFKYVMICSYSHIYRRFPIATFDYWRVV